MLLPRAPALWGLSVGCSLGTGTRGKCRVCPFCSDPLAGTVTIPAQLRAAAGTMLGGSRAGHWLQILCKRWHQDLGTSGASVATPMCYEDRLVGSSTFTASLPCCAAHSLLIANGSPGLAVPARPQQDDSSVPSFSTGKRNINGTCIERDGAWERAPVPVGPQCLSAPNLCLKCKQRLKPSCK